MKVTTCRICSGTAFLPVLDLGDMPAVNYFPADDEPDGGEARYPLRLCVCQGCGLVMLDEVVPPETLFRRYHYLTSASQPLVDHFAALAAECTAQGWVASGSRVLDIGANDGTLLQAFAKVGAWTLGIDPATNAVEQARRRGLTVLPEFFGEAVAARLAPTLGAFDLITCTNVFAHTDDAAGFLAGVRRLLAPGGLVIMEFAHLLDIVVKRQFDVIYHEHVSYFALQPLTRLFRQCGFTLVDAKKVLTQGGSVRIYARLDGDAHAEPSAQFQALCREEATHHLSDPTTLLAFADDVRRFRRDFRRLLADIRRQGHTVVGLGAPAKGVILANYCGLGPDDIAYIVDSTELKQGRLLPGTRIPVRAERSLDDDPVPDYFLLFAWNFQEAMLKKVARHRAAGARVIVPFPDLRVI